jgi:3'-phosphoadenosine 5'-phosphosulfate sulfotransferase (PAPS reductase)/FAD synthetase
MSPVAPATAVDASVRAAIAEGARVVFSLSGGKDSAAAAFAASRWLDMVGHPRELRSAIHADLGMIEWRSTAQVVEQTAAHLGVPLTVVRRKAGGLITRWEQRWKSSLERYENLATYQLVSPWSSAKLRYCTSETKVAPIGSHLRREFAGETIISVVGIRKEESRARSAEPISKADTRFAARGNRAKTQMITWHPAIDWTAAQVFAWHEAEGVALHEAYQMGATRLSCSFCVLAGVRNLAVSAACKGNHDAFRRIVALENVSAFAFQPNRWLADIAPGLLNVEEIASSRRARELAAHRRTLEARLPADLRFKRGWPPRIPSLDEAQKIAAVRNELLRRHNLRIRWPDAAAVRARFAELHAAREEAA